MLGSQKLSLDANALITLAEAKQFLQITASDEDSFIETLINAASQRAATFCDRVFVETSYRESYNGTKQKRLRLRNYPVTSISRLAYGSKLAFTVEASDATDVRVTVEVQDDKVVLNRFASNGTQTTSNVAFSSYKTASALVGEINSTTGFTATLNSNCLAEDLYRAGGINVLSSAGQFYFPDQDDTSFRLHEDRATLELIDTSDYAFFASDTDQGGRFPRTFSGIRVDYTAGFTADDMPEDLKMAVKLIVQFIYNYAKSDATLTSESIGEYSYSKTLDAINPDSLAYDLLRQFVNYK